jgi:hypothetical protein
VTVTTYLPQNYPLIPGKISSDKLCVFFIDLRFERVCLEAQGIGVNAFIYEHIKKEEQTGTADQQEEHG